jgi:hypothetical protein
MALRWPMSKRSPSSNSLSNADPDFAFKSFSFDVVATGLRVELAE